MKLKCLKLTNFRGFREFEISFDPSFTVLLGANMAGKTAVLDGAAVALTGPLDKLYVTSYRDIEAGEVFQVVKTINGIPDLQRQVPAKVQARATFLGAELRWSRVRDEGRNATETIGVDHVRFIPDDASGPPMDLPAIAYYGTRRLWQGDEPVHNLRGVGSRFDGYSGCFDVTSTHSALVAWIHKQTLVQLQRGGGYLQPQLSAVESAVKSCVDSVTRFWFDIQYDELRLERVGGDIQSFSMLSEGYRNMVAMVADIAWRASVLNPHHGPEAHLRTDGVVLIDELDLHLHPAWQRRIIEDLRRTFPRIQFIVTTHSPQIVASVKRREIRLLEQNRLVAGEPHVEGRDSNAILEDVFGVPSRPEGVQAEIDAMFRLIEDEEFAAARERLAELQERLGPDDTAMIKARWILDTEETGSNGQHTRAP